MVSVGAFAIDPDDVLTLALEVEPVAGDGLEVFLVRLEKAVFLAQAHDPGLFFGPDVLKALPFGGEFIAPQELRAEEFPRGQDKEGIDHQLHQAREPFPQTGVRHPRRRRGVKDELGLVGEVGVARGHGKGGWEDQTRILPP